MGKTKHQPITSKTEFFYYAFRNILLVGLPLLVISSFILSHSFSRVLADNPNNGSGSSTDNLSFSISSSCTLSSVVDSSHSAELINGTYKDNIGKSTITTLCNDGNGYSIYANGYSNDEEGNNNLINTTNSNFSIPSGLVTSGLDSNWAMSLNNVIDDTSPTPPVVEDDYDGVYGLVPNEWTKVASLPSSATDMNQGSSFTTTYAVYTSSSQTTGTYNGKVKYMLVHPSYKPAVYFMQDVASWKNLIGMEESVQAVDKRDGKSYWVTKLKDGNIWMTQNLDFDIDSAKTYTHYDTDLGWAILDSDVTWRPTYSTVNFVGATVSGWQVDYTPQSANPGDIYYYTSGSDVNDTQYDSLQDCANGGHTELECKHYHVGNYYNWPATMASNNDSPVRNGNDIVNSICPAGWRLPSINNNEFENLLLSYDVIGGTGSTVYTTGGFDIVRSMPIYFVRSGNIEWNSNKLDGVGARGGYWSSTATDSCSATYTSFESGTIYPGYCNVNFPIKRVGYPVRCVAR